MDITQRKQKLRAYQGAGDRVFMTCVYAILLMLSLTIILPIINIISSSFSSPYAVTSGQVKFLPVEFTLNGYRAVFSNNLIVTGFINSIIYTVFGTFVDLSLTLMAAFPLSRERFYGKKLIIGFFTVTMFINGGLVPNYVLITKLGLFNTRLAMILPAGVSVMYMVVARTYIKTTVGTDMLGAAEVDGCSEARLFFQIVLPLAKPLIAVMVLNYAIGHWNSYFDGLLYLRQESLYSLQMVMRKILILGEIDITKMDTTMFNQQLEKQYLANLIKYSSIIVTSLPLMFLYPFIQKHFVKGMMLGSLKG